MAALVSEMDKDRSDYSRRLQDERSRCETLEKDVAEIRSELERKKLELVTMVSERDKIIS